MLSALLLSSQIWAATLDSSAHFQIIDSTGERWIQARFTLAESLQNRFSDKEFYQSSTWARLETWGQVTPQLSFVSTTTVFTDIGNRYYPFHDYQSYRGIPYNVKDSAGQRTWDYLTAVTTLESTPQRQIHAGLDYLQMGPSYRNPLSWSGESAPLRPWMDSSTAVLRPAPVLFVGFDLELSWVQYRQYSGQLQHTRGKDKFFHTHRLEFQLPFHLQLGLSETVVYGSSVDVEGSPYNSDEVRNMAWLYAMPFVPYMFAGHYYGDRDNGAMSFDLTAQPMQNLKLYGELLLDDSKSPTSLFDDSWWGNKWGFSGGLLFQKKLQTWDTRFRAEYTQIMPWVYTHNLGPSHQYTHFNQSLGSNLGPNSQEIFTQVEAEYSCWKFSSHLSFVAKDTAFGSQITDIHKPTDPMDRVVLSPSSTLHYSEAGLQGSYSPKQLPIFAALGATRYWGDYHGWRSDLSAGVYW